MRLLRPQALESGDSVSVVAPASPFGRPEFDAGLAELRRLEFHPLFEESVFERHHFVAGQAESRARAFESAWTNPRVKGIIGARGGYGSVQILPHLNPARLRSAPRVFVGYSDVTALLSYLTTRCGIVAFHGPMVAGRLSKGEAGYDRLSFLRAVMNREPLGELAAPALEALKDGEAAGLLYGGNLTQLAASLGTPFAFDPPNGCVLLIEDVNERPYRLDRLMTQLIQAGVLARAAAIVFGEMPECDEPDGSVTGKAVLAGLTAGFPGPVLFGLPTGHTRGAALTVPLGVRARVIGRPGPMVVIEEPAVS